MEMLTTFGLFDRDSTIDAMYLTHVYLPGPNIDKWVGHTNAYANDNVPSHKFKLVKNYDIIQIIAIYYHMGLVKLPAKEDYWKQGGVWPAHSFTDGMSQDCFH